MTASTSVAHPLTFDATEKAPTRQPRRRRLERRLQLREVGACHLADLHDIGDSRATAGWWCSAANEDDRPLGLGPRPRRRARRRRRCRPSIATSRLAPAVAPLPRKRMLSCLPGAGNCAPSSAPRRQSRSTAARSWRSSCACCRTSRVRRHVLLDERRRPGRCSRRTGWRAERRVDRQAGANLVGADVREERRLVGRPSASSWSSRGDRGGGHRGRGRQGRTRTTSHEVAVPRSSRRPAGRRLHDGAVPTDNGTVIAGTMELGIPFMSSRARPTSTHLSVSTIRGSLPPSRASWPSNSTQLETSRCRWARPRASTGGSHRVVADPHAGCLRAGQPQQTDRDRRPHGGRVFAGLLHDGRRGGGRARPERRADAAHLPSAIGSIHLSVQDNRARAASSSTWTAHSACTTTPRSAS